jgi:uroporphyrinogen-III decarboxylase
MNTRERFVNVLTGKPVDRVPFMKVFGGANQVLPRWEANYPGLSKEIDQICQFEGRHRGWDTTRVNFDLSCVGTWEIIAEDETSRTARRPDGLVKIFVKGSNFHHQTIEFPVKCRADWDRIKAEFLDPDDPARFPADWEGKVEEYRGRDWPLQLTHRGVYGFPRVLMGDEALAFAFYDDPAMVHDIMDTYTDFAIRLWEKMTPDVDFDLIECWEDMCSKNGSIISPAMFREFMAPNYRRIRAFANAHDIPIVLVDSDGNIEKLAELMLEAGVNAMYPYEILASNDLDEARERLPGMAAIGGLKKEAMAEGDEAVEFEMERAARLIRKGKFIPGPDHFVQSHTSWPQYRDFMARLREVVLSTPVEG